MKFELDTTDGRARRGRLVFDRGVVEMRLDRKSVV